MEEGERPSIYTVQPSTWPTLPRVPPERGTYFPSTSVTKRG